MDTEVRATRRRREKGPPARAALPPELLERIAAGTGDAGVEAIALASKKHRAAFSEALGGIVSLKGLWAACPGGAVEGREACHQARANLKAAPAHEEDEVLFGGDELPRSKSAGGGACCVPDFQDDLGWQKELLRAARRGAGSYLRILLATYGEPPALPRGFEATLIDTLVARGRVDALPLLALPDRGFLASLLASAAAAYGHNAAATAALLSMRRLRGDHISDFEIDSLVYRLRSSWLLSQGSVEFLEALWPWIPRHRRGDLGRRLVAIAGREREMDLQLRLRSVCGVGKLGFRDDPKLRRVSAHSRRLDRFFRAVSSVDVGVVVEEVTRRSHPDGALELRLWAMRRWLARRGDRYEKAILGLGADLPVPWPAPLSASLALANGHFTAAASMRMPGGFDAARALTRAPRLPAASDRALFRSLAASCEDYPDDFLSTVFPQGGLSFLKNLFGQEGAALAAAQAIMANERRITVSLEAAAALASVTLSAGSRAIVDEALSRVHADAVAGGDLVTASVAAGSRNSS